MLDEIKTELIDKDEDYIVCKNGKIIYKSNDEISFDFTSNVDIKVIHIIDQDTNITYKINKNIDIKISEIFYNVSNSPKIELKIELDSLSKCDYTSFRRTKIIREIKANVNAYLEQGSYLNYKTLNFHFGDGIITENFYLQEENTEAKIKNVLINISGSSQDFNINIHHNAKHSISNLLNFGICKNESFLKINSKGIIKQGSHKAEIRQRAKGLLLDEVSNLSANPLLEIDDFDVIANHGASIGAIDEDELYYLMSRGLSREDSEKLIVAGFINPVLADIKEGKFQDYILSWINTNI